MFFVFACCDNSIVHILNGQYCILLLFYQVMEADAVVLLGEGDLNVPPTWVRPGAAVIQCEFPVQGFHSS